MQMQEYLQDKATATAAGDKWALDPNNAMTAAIIDRHNDDWDTFAVLMSATHVYPQYSSYALVSASKGGSEIMIPKSWHEAMRHPELWMPPMQKEIATLLCKGVWRLEQPPLGAHVISGMWVYDIKVDGAGNLIKPKSSLGGTWGLHAAWY
jgi:hypothetical protein